MLGLSLLINYPSSDHAVLLMLEKICLHISSPEPRLPTAIYDFDTLVRFLQIEYLLCYFEVLAVDPFFLELARSEMKTLGSLLIASRRLNDILGHKVKASC